MKQLMLTLISLLSIIWVQTLWATPTIPGYIVAYGPMNSGYLKKTNSVEHGFATGNHYSTPLSPPGPVKKNQTHTQKLIAACSNEMLALTNPTQIVTYLETHNLDSCVDDLWNYTDNYKNLFTQPNLTAVLNEIAYLSMDFDGTNNSHLLELVFFVRVAFYHNWYHRGVFDIEALRPLVASALSQVFGNAHIYDITSVAGNILEQCIQAADSSETNVALDPVLENTLALFYDSITARNKIYSQTSALYALFSTYARAISNRLVTTATPRLIETLKKFSIMVVSRNDWWIPNNSSWVLGNIVSKVPAAKALAMAALEAAYNVQVPWGSPWVWVVRDMTLSSDCVTLSTNQQVCLSKTRTELQNRLFPTVYTFDNRALVVNTSLSKSTLEPLFYATNEVKSQAGRVMKGLIPVPNDSNATLNIYLYATRNDYSDFHTFLFNLSSDNGGIYIEQNGTFYTYERTPQESIYTLQELFRHEYTHYVIGRFLVPGMWGEVPIYDNNRMVFFDEGIAEFFAGSTAREGILERASLVKVIKSDGPSRRLSIAQLMSATYDTYGFYHYGGLFFHFLYTKHIDILQKIMDLIRNNNIAGFDAYKAELSANSGLNTEYQAYLDAAVADLPNLGTPTTIPPTPANLIYKVPAEIKTQLDASQLVAPTTCTETATSPYKLFTCQTQIAGTAIPSQDAILGWNSLNTKTNQFQKKVIATQAGTNLDWLTCWYTGIQWTTPSAGSFIPSSQLTCTGPLGS